MFIILKTYNFQCGFSTKVPCTFLLQENTDEPEKPKFFHVTEQKKVRVRVPLWIGHWHLVWKVNFNYAYSPFSATWWCTFKISNLINWYDSIQSLKYLRAKLGCIEMKFIWTGQKFWVVNLRISHWSPSYAVLQINLISLRYPAI